MNRAETAQKYNEQWFRGAPFGDPAADPEYEQLARRFLCGDVLPRGTLTQAQKALVILAGLIAGNLFPALRRYTRAALSAGGAAPAETKEASPAQRTSSQRPVGAPTSRGDLKMRDHLQRHLRPGRLRAAGQSPRRRP